MCSFCHLSGSIRQDIPASGLAETLNVQFVIASQCNPHVVPFFFNPQGGVGRPSRWSSGDQEHSWRGGFVLAALEMYLKVCLFVCLFMHDSISWFNRPCEISDKSLRCFDNSMWPIYRMI